MSAPVSRCVVSFGVGAAFLPRRESIKPLLGGFLGSAEDEKKQEKKFQNRGESSGFRNKKYAPG